MTSHISDVDPTGPAVLEWSMAAASLVGGAVVALVGSGYGLTNVTGVGAGFFPLVAGVIMIAAGALWLIQLAAARRAIPDLPDALRHAEPLPTTGATFTDLAERFEVEDEIEEDADDVEFPDRLGWRRVGIIVLSVLIAALILPVLGYTISMTLMLASVLFFVSERRWWLAVVIGIGAALASRLVFEGWLGTQLPVSSIDLIAMMGL